MTAQSHGHAHHRSDPTDSLAADKRRVGAMKSFLEPLSRAACGANLYLHNKFAYARRRFKINCIIGAQYCLQLPFPRQMHGISMNAP